MKKLSYLIIAIALLGVSCNNSQEKTKENNAAAEEQSVIKATPEEVTEVTVADFSEKAGSLVGKPVKIKAIVDHVCKHGGQKMVLVDQNTEKRVKVVPDEKIAAFKPELEGQDVVVTGVVDELKVDEDYLMDWENEVKEGEKEPKGEAMHEGKEAGEEKDEAENAMKQINALRKKLKESGKDHLSYYSIICSEYEVLPEENEGGDTEK